MAVVQFRPLHPDSLPIETRARSPQKGPASRSSEGTPASHTFPTSFNFQSFFSCSVQQGSLIPEIEISIRLLFPVIANLESNKINEKI